MKSKQEIITDFYKNLKSYFENCEDYDYSPQSIADIKILHNKEYIYYQIKPENLVMFEHSPKTKLTNPEIIILNYAVSGGLRASFALFLTGSIPHKTKKKALETCKPVLRNLLIQNCPCGKKFCYNCNKWCKAETLPVDEDVKYETDVGEVMPDLFSMKEFE